MHTATAKYDTTCRAVAITCNDSGVVLAFVSFQDVLKGHLATVALRCDALQLATQLDVLTLDHAGRPIREYSVHRTLRLQASIQELARAGQALLRVNEELMPGVRHLALQDYSALNTAPNAMRWAISHAHELLRGET